MDVLSFPIPFAGMKNVAFFFSAISTQSLKKLTGKKKANEEDEESDENEQFPDSVKSRVQQTKNGLVVTRQLSTKSCAHLLVIGSR